MSETFDASHVWLGIRPEEQPPDCHRLLGLERFEDRAEVIEHAADQRMAHLKSLAVGPHLVPLAEASLIRAQAVLEKGDFNGCQAALLSLEAKYSAIPWYAAKKGSIDLARLAASRGIAVLEKAVANRDRPEHNATPEAASLMAFGSPSSMELRLGDEER